LPAKQLGQPLCPARAEYGGLALRGIEVSAALVIAAFGLLLLVGYMSRERLIGV
jgi:hypothetical protein